MTVKDLIEILSNKILIMKLHLQRKHGLMAVIGGIMVIMNMKQWMKILLRLHLKNAVLIFASKEFLT